MRNAIALAGVMVATMISASAAQWPQFRGPSGQGLATETNLPLDWSETRHVAWKTPVPGRGWSSPVVGDGRVWVTTAVQNRGEASLRVLAFDLASGRELLNVEVFRVWRDELTTNAKNSNATPTPILDGERVYVHFGASGTAALSTSDGKVLWKTRLPHDTQHGQGGSPALVGNLLVINCDGFEDPYVIALDTATGKSKWRRGRRQPTSQAYSTPLPIRVGDVDQVVSVGASFATAFEASTGREIWRVAYRDGFSNVPRPVFAHGLVFIATGFQQPSLMAVRVDGTGDVTKTHVAWTLTRGAPLTPSPIVVGDEIFVVNDHGIAQCLDVRTGQPHWVQRLPGAYAASPTYADGRIYFLNEEGLTTVLAPGREFRVLAQSQLEGETLASMAVVPGAFVLRSSTHLYRIAAR